MTTARDLLTAAFFEAARGNAGTVWWQDIAATPSGAELLRRADEAERLRGALGFLSTYEKRVPEMLYDEWAYNRLLAFVHDTALAALGNLNRAEVEPAEPHRTRGVRHAPALATPATDDAEPTRSAEDHLHAHINELVARITALEGSMTPATNDAEPDPTALLRGALDDAIAKTRTLRTDSEGWLVMTTEAVESMRVLRAALATPATDEARHG